MRYAVLIICIYSQVVTAQTSLRSIHNYTTRNGLSNNNVYCIIQDTRGFLWLGTREGLNSFDGYRFKSFFSEKEPAAGLADNLVLDILEYQAGRLLIATANGLSVFNTHTGSFENDKIKAPSPHAGSGIMIASLFKDKSGKIWINHSGEFDLLDSNLNYIHRVTDLPWAQSLKGTVLRAHSIREDKQQRLWLPGDTTGIHIIDWNAKKIYNSKNNPFNYPFLTTQFTRSLLLDEQNSSLWFGHWGSGLKKYDFKNNSTLQILFNTAKTNEEQSVNALHLTNSGQIFFLTGTGFFRADTGNHLLQPVNLSDGILPGQARASIFYSIFHSKDNQYWLGTSNGLWQLKNEEPFLRKLPIDLKAGKNELPVNTGITVSPNGKLYLGFAPGGLVEIEQDRTRYHIYHLNAGPQIRISRIYADDEGLVWIGTTEGLFQFNPALKKITRVHSLPPELMTANIASIHKSKNGTLWVSTRDRFGLWRMKKNSGIFEKAESDLLEKFSSLGINSRISEFIEDENTNTWMISRLGGGLISFNEINNGWRYFPIKEENKSSLAKKGLNFIDIGKDNNLWLTDVLGNGLLEYLYLKDSLVKYTRIDGFPSSILKAVCSDGKDHLWIATDYGLSLFDKKRRQVVSTVYYDYNGDSPEARLAYDKFSGSIISIQDNHVVFFDEASTISFATTQAKPIVESFFVNNSKKPVSADKMKLKSFQKNITIYFTAVQFLNADKIKFAYRLDKADNEWKEADAGRVANYSLLSPGNYRFYLKATDVNGNWGPEYMLLSFIIAPPFWKTWWFISGSAILLLAIVFRLYRYRIHQLIRLQKVRNRIATDLHDDIGTSLTNISILSELTHKHIREREQAETFIQRISEEVSRSGQALDDIVWSINTKNDSLEEVAARMRRYAAEIFEGGGISYSLDMEDHLGGRKLNMEQRRDLFLIFKEVINNIYKHADAKNVSMKLTMASNELQFIIKDDGKGFDTTAVNSRNGIKNMQQRIGRWKGTIRIESVPGKGTRTFFSLPVRKASPK